MLERRVSKQATVRERILGDHGFLVSPVGEFALNESAAVLWSHIGAGRTLGALSAALARHYGLHPQHVSADVEAVVNQWAAHKLVTVVPGGTGDTVTTPDPPPPTPEAWGQQIREVWQQAKERLVPLKLVLELTYRCNLRCQYCYADSPGGQYLKAAQLAEVLAEAATLGALLLSVTGGEPLLHPEAIEVIRCASRLGYSVRLQSNGTLISEPEAEALAAARVDCVTVTVHGASPETHDDFTGVSGSFAALNRGLRCLRNAGVPTVAKMIITNRNWREIEAARDLASQYSATLQVSPLLYPTSAGDASPLAFRLGDEEVASLMERGLVSPVPDPCGAGTAKAVVGPKGDVYPCPFVHMAVGDLQTTSFSEIWRGDALHGLRSQGAFERPSACRTCEHLSYCPHCPAIAWHEDGGFDRPSREACRLARLYATVRRGGQPWSTGYV